MNKKLSIKFQKIVTKVFGITPLGTNEFKKEGIFTTENIKGYNNKVIIVDENNIERELMPHEKIKGLEILFCSDYNTVKIHNPVKFIKTRLIMGAGQNKLVIKSSCYKIEKSVFQIYNSNEVLIGTDFSVATDLNLIAYGLPHNKIVIGDDCMLSGFIWIRNSDNHIMYDMENFNELVSQNAGKNNKENLVQAALNKPEDVIIGNHCWISHGAIILKGADVPDNSIIGTVAVVNKKYDKQNVVIAGVPGKIVKENVGWDRSDF